MNKVEAYRASDGQLFETEDKCRQYEASLVWRARIDEFIASDLFPFRKTGAQPAIAGKTIVAWEAFKVSADSAT